MELCPANLHKIRNSPIQKTLSTMALKRAPRPSVSCCVMHYRGANIPRCLVARCEAIACCELIRAASKVQSSQNGMQIITGPQSSQNGMQTNTGPQSSQNGIQTNTGPQTSQNEMQTNTGPQSSQNGMQTNTGPQLFQNRMQANTDHSHPRTG